MSDGDADRDRPAKLVGPWRVGIAIDDWKLDTFARRLTAAGYPFSKGPGLTPGTLLLSVETMNPAALECVVRAAAAECNEMGE